MPCPICGAKCVCRKRGEDGRCCSCHKHKARTPSQAAAHQEYDRKQRDASQGAAMDLVAELKAAPDERRIGFTYPGLFDHPVVTDLLIFRDGAVPVVVATERGDNPGASITNTIEKLAAALSKETGWQLGDFILVEHYPPGRYDDPTLERALDRVHFGRMWGDVTWRHFGLDGLKALVGPATVEAKA